MTIPTDGVGSAPRLDYLLEATGQDNAAAFAATAERAVVVIPFADGHTRQLPRPTKGPVRYSTYRGG